MKDFYKRFVTEEFDENGILSKFDLNLEKNYNFAYDVIDELAKIEPDKICLFWINEEGEEHRFTFKEVSEMSNRYANMFLAHGVKKGDMVMLVLKRHYEFWFAVYGLMKMGAVVIPATNQLLAKDYVYRFDAASVKYICATTEDGVCEHIEEALQKYDGIVEKFCTHGDRDGWIPLGEEAMKYSPELDRIENDVDDTMLLYFSSGTTGYPKMVIHNHY